MIFLGKMITFSEIKTGSWYKFVSGRHRLSEGYGQKGVLVALLHRSLSWKVREWVKDI